MATDNKSANSQRNPAAGSERRDAVEVSLNLPQDVVQVLQSLAAKEGRTMTEIIRRGIEIEKYLADLRERSAKVLVKEGRKIQEVKFE
jgi:predicted DNA-binding protein